MGGMAEIYLARSMAAAGVSKFFAIKRILPQFSEQIEFIDMFKDEAKIAVNISHANIVSIYEFGVEKSQFFLAMDYVEGRNLRQILNKMKKSGVAFSIEQVIFIIKEVAAGLDAAHRCIDANTGKPLNIIHRDMSPQNVMVSFEGEVKVVDFGIAKAETQIETTRAGTLKGKFGYMSPEQAEGQSIDLRTDIFALGIVFWELLANDRLFVANNEVNTLRKIRDCQVPSLRKINPNIPQELERIVSKALAKDRNLRYQTGAAFQRDLSKFLNRQFPDFSPHDFSVFIKTLFAGEILESRKKMIEYARVDTRMETHQQPALMAAPSAVERQYDPGDRTVMTQTNSVTENTNSTSEPKELGAPEPRDNRPRPSFGNSPTVPQIPPVPKISAPPALSIPPNSVRPASKSFDQSLSVDRTGFRERSSLMGGSNVGINGSYHSSSGTRSNYTRTTIRKTGFQLQLPIGFIFSAVVAVAGIFYYLYPEEATGYVNDIKSRVAHFSGRSEQSNLASKTIEAAPPLKADADYINFVVKSQPAGAEILIDGRSISDVAPTNIKLERDTDVTLTLRLQGYFDYEEKIHVTRSKLISAALRPDRKGKLDINVVGAGQIFVDGVLVGPQSPAIGISVPADKDVLVSTFDPATNSGDETRVSVSEGRTRKITLIPRANYKPHLQGR